MSQGDDERAQSVQIGVVILFGFLVVALASYQAVVVPQQNARTEFDAYQVASDDLSEVRNDLLVAAGRDAEVGTTVRTGAQYRQRTVSINPPPPSGRIATGDQRTVTLTNVTAVDAEQANTRRFWNGTQRQYTTRDVVFEPRYNEIDLPRIVVNGHSAYRDADTALVPIASQSLVTDDRIALTTLTGSVRTSGYSATLTTSSVSPSDRTVLVTGTGETFTVTLPTTVSASVWNDSSMADSLRANPNVTSVSVAGANTVNVTFDGDATYRLRMARVGVQAENGGTDFDEPGPAYVIKKSGDNATVSEGQSVELTAAVLDRFNNGVSGSDGTEVSFVTSDGSFSNGASTVTVSPDSEGLASVVFTPDESGFSRVTARVDVDGDGDYDEPVESTTFVVQAISSSLAGGGGNFDMAVRSGSAVDVTDTGVRSGIRFNISNLRSDSVTVTDIAIERTSTRASRVTESRNGGGRWNRELFVNVNDSSPTTADADDGHYEAGDGGNSAYSIGSTVALSQNATLAADDTATLYLYEFREGGGGGGGTAVDMSGTFLEVTIYYTTANGNQESVTATVFAF